MTLTEWSRKIKAAYDNYYMTGNGVFRFDMKCAYNMYKRNGGKRSLKEITHNSNFEN